MASRVNVWALRMMLGLGSTALTAIPPVEAQQTQTQSFDIAPQALSSTLLTFAEQSGLEVLFDARIAQGRSSPGARGNLSREQALRQILAGTNLSYRFIGSYTVTLEQNGALAIDGDGVVLPTITVQGEGAYGERRSEEEDAPFTTPGSDAFISREQIDRVRPTAPGDIFRTVPGVFSSASNDGNSINVNIRGAQGLNRVRTMVEGTQQDTTGNRGYAGSDQRSYVDPELIGGIDISKGPGTGPYGAGSTSGVVNVRLLEADDLVSPGSTYGFRIRGGIGGNRIAPTCDEGSKNVECSLRPPGTDPGLRSGGNGIFTDDNWFGSLAAAHRSDHFEFVAAYSRREEGNYFAGENGDETFEVRGSRGRMVEQRFSVFERGQEISNTSEETQSTLFKGTFRFGDGHSVQAGLNWYESQFGMAYPTSLVSLAPNQTTLNDVQSNRLWLRYNWDSGNDLIDLQANVWSTHIEEQGELRQASQENESWGGELWNTSIVDTGFGELSMTYGAEYSRSEGIILDYVPLSRTDYAVGQPPVVTSLGSAPDFEGTREVFGGHFNAAFSPINWLTVNAGVRYDRFEGESRTPVSRDEVDNAAFRAENDRLWNAVFDAEEACDDLWPDGAAIDACYAANVDPLLDEIDALQTRQDEFRSGFQETVAQRNTSEADRLSPNFGVTLEPLDGLQLFARYAEGFRALSMVELGQSFAFGTTFNPDLEPEVLKTWEFGLNYADNGVLFDDDAFRFKFVYFDNNYKNFIGRPFEGAPFENYDDVSVSGIETTLSYDMGHIFADLNVSYYNELPEQRTIASLEQPIYSGTLTAGMRWFDERLELGARATFFDERQPEIGGELTLVDVPRYWQANVIVDVFGSFDVNDILSVNLSVENVADEYYLPPLFVNRMPAPGRTVRAGFTTSFDF